MNFGWQPHLWHGRPQHNPSARGVPNWKANGVDGSRWARSRMAVESHRRGGAPPVTYHPRVSQKGGFREANHGWNQF